MRDVETFDDIVLTDTYADMGEKICSDKQRLLFEGLSQSEKLIYAAYSTRDVMSTDLYGPIKIQSVGSEDRLFFPKNHAHVHVKWSQVSIANLVKIPDHPAGKDCYWIGIEFLTKERATLFHIWNLQPDQEFSPEVCQNLGELL
jgi:hypothetical protein